MIKYIFPLVLFSITAKAQLGGSQSYEYLSVPINARIAAAGGQNVSLRDQDVNLIFQNPATLNAEMRKQFAFNYSPYLAGIKATSVAYALPYKKNTFGLGLVFFDYGKIDETESNGTITGATLKVKEYALAATASHTIGNYVMGASLKFAGSDLAGYSSRAILADVGGLFVHPKRQWTVGMTVKNLGYAFNSYSPGDTIDLPIDLQLGTSYKLENLPLRFSVTAHHLYDWDLVFIDPNKKSKKDLEGNEIVEKKKVGDEIMRHFIFAGEFLLTKNINLRFGYNHMRRKELRLIEKSAGAGFSMGAMVRIRSFEFAYTRAYYSVAGASNHLSLIANFNTLLKKKDSNTKSAQQ